MNQEYKGLNEEEREVMKQLTNAVLAYNELDVIHPEDTPSFYRNINRLQDLIYSRAYRRMFGLYPQYER